MSETQEPQGCLSGLESALAAASDPHLRTVEEKLAGSSYSVLGFVVPKIVRAMV